MHAEKITNADGAPAITDETPRFVNAFNDIGIIVGYYWQVIATGRWKVRVRETNRETECESHEDCEEILRRHRAKTFRVHY